MPRSFGHADIAEVLRGIREVAGSVADQTRDCFGDPFIGRLTNAECRRIADLIETARVGGFVLFRHGMTLVWTKIDGRLHFELSVQGEHYATLIAAVHRHFQQYGFKPAPAMIFE